MPEAGLEPARPKTGDFKTSATPFIPISADPATVGVCAETVASVDLAKNSISPEYCLRGARDARVQGELQGESEGHKQSAAELLDLTHSGRRSARGVYGCCYGIEAPTYVCCPGLAEVALYRVDAWAILDAMASRRCAPFAWSTSDK